MYDVSLRRIRAIDSFEGFEGSYFTAGPYRYHRLSEINLRLAISLGLLSDAEASWAWDDLLNEQHWESVRLPSQLTWLLEKRKPRRICVIRDGNRDLLQGQHFEQLQTSGYRIAESNRVFERWVLRSSSF